MKIAKVIDNIWTTHKGEKLAGLKLLLVQPLDVLMGKTERPPTVTADIIGASVGETVLVIGGSSARSAAGDMGVPVDATVVGIMDDQEINHNMLPWRRGVAAARRKLPQKEWSYVMNLTEAVKATGVVDAGGAEFPTHVRLSAKAEYFLVNTAEYGPLIEADKYLCCTFPGRVVAAMVVVAGHLGAEHTMIALKGKYHAGTTALEGTISRSDAQVELFRMKTFYLAGDEQTMVQQVIGRPVPERGLPLDVGCVVDSAGTLLNIQDTLEGTPVAEEYLSVVGEVKKLILLEAPVGTVLTAYVAGTRPNLADYALIMGGPMMDKPLTNRAAIEAAVVTKTTRNLIVLPKEHYLSRRAQLPMEIIRHQTKSACIQCRMCTDLCLRYLTGHQVRSSLVMRDLWREGSIEDNEEYLRSFDDAANCYDCDVCEMFAYPMDLSPRRVNGCIKGRLRRRDTQVPRNMESRAREFVDERKAPADRLVARLGLSTYYGLHAHTCIPLEPETVFIPLQRHIGKPVMPVRAVGDPVAKEELLAQVAPGGPSANIHASIDGVVTEITPAGAGLCRKKV